MTAPGTGSVAAGRGMVDDVELDGPGVVAAVDDAADGTDVAVPFACFDDEQAPMASARASVTTTAREAAFDTPSSCLGVRGRVSALRRNPRGPFGPNRRSRKESVATPEPSTKNA
jgi:hypothetical protein